MEHNETSLIRCIEFLHLRKSVTNAPPRTPQKQQQRTEREVDNGNGDNNDDDGGDDDDGDRDNDIDSCRFRLSESLFFAFPLMIYSLHGPRLTR